MRSYPAGGADFLDDDGVGFLQQRQAFARDLAEDADRQARSRERLADQELLVDPEVAANGAHFILEQLAQRLDELELHALRQAADVVVTLDRRRGPAHRHRFDHVRIQRALREKVEFTQLLRLVVEDVDEGLADDLALLLGVGDAREAIEERGAGIDVMHRQLQLLVALHHLARLVEAKQAVVDEDALQPIADGAVDQRRGHRVDAARQTAHHAAVPTCAWMRSVASSMNDAIVQSPVQPQTSNAKLRNSSLPRSVCATSG